MPSKKATKPKVKVIKGWAVEINGMYHFYEESSEVAKLLQKYAQKDALLPATLTVEVKG
jgi:hypothetical protein